MTYNNIVTLENAVTYGKRANFTEFFDKSKTYIVSNDVFNEVKNGKTQCFMETPYLFNLISGDGMRDKAIVTPVPLERRTTTGYIDLPSYTWSSFSQLLLWTRWLNCWYFIT